MHEAVAHTGDFTVALLTLSGTIIGSTALLLIAIFKTYGQSRIAAVQSREINDAVNHRHTDQPRAFDMISSLHKWRASFENSPFNDGLSLQVWMDERTKADNEHREVHARIEKRLGECSHQD